LEHTRGSGAVHAAKHHPKVSTGLLTATKKRPGKSTLRGLLQVVTSSLQALLFGRRFLSGDGGRRPDGPTTLNVGTISLNTTSHQRRDYSPLSATVNSANVRTSANVLAAMATARAATKMIFAIALSLGKPCSTFCRTARFIAVTGITICRANEGYPLSWGIAAARMIPFNLAGDAPTARLVGT
jgi:hypothetical protein